jgi:P27 family predicted phage terminase small subunit
VAAVTVKPPAWLSRRGKRIFRDLTKVIADLSILDPADYIALSMLADALDDYRTFGEKVEEDGPTFKSTANREGEVLIKANPAVSMKADAWRRVQSGLAKFGLQPKARDGLKLPEPKEKNRFDDDF